MSRWFRNALVVACVAVMIAFLVSAWQLVTLRIPGAAEREAARAAVPERDSAREGRRRGAAEEDPAAETDESPPADAPPNDVTLHVVSAETGAPVPFPQLSATEYGAEGSEEPQVRALRGDENGVVRVTTLHQIFLQSGCLTAPGFVRCFTWSASPSECAAGAATVRLVPGTTLSGVVVDAKSGRPLSGVAISAIDPSFPGCFAATPPPYGEGKTAADGSFAFREIPTSECVQLQFRAAGRVPQDVEWTSEKSRRFRIQLAPGGMIRGVLRDTDGSPSKGDWVHAAPAGVDTLRGAETDEDGRFEIDGLPLDTPLELWATVNNYPVKRVSAVLPGIELTEAAPLVERDLTLLEPAKLVVELRDADGKPLKGRVLATLPPEGRLKNDGVPDDGEAPTLYNVTVPRAGPVHLRVSADSMRTLEQTIDVRADEVREIVVTMERGPLIAGIVVDPEGKPVDRADVAVGHPNSFEWSARTSTDEQGRFEVCADGDEPVEVHVSAQDGSCDAKFEQPTTEARLVLREPVAPTRIKFRPRVPEGTEQPKWLRVCTSASLEFGDEPRSQEWMDEIVQDVSPGRGVVVLRSRQFGDGTRDFYVGTGEAVAIRHFDIKAGETLDLGEIVLDRGITVTGRVKDSAGSPVVEAAVRALAGLELENPVAWTGDDGAFTLRHVPRSGAKVRVTAEGYLPSEIAIGASGAPMSVILSRGGLVKGTAKIADDEVLDAVREDGTDRAWVHVEDGRFEIRLNPGAWRFEFIEKDDTRREGPRVVVREDEETVVDVPDRR